MIDVNPYQSSNESPVRKPHQGISIVKLLLSCAAGLFAGLVGAFGAFASGFHGNLPYLWLYICGPTTWVIELFASSDHAYVIALVAGSIIQWVLYSVVLVAPIGEFRMKACALASIHLGCAALYHTIVGIG